MRILSGEHGCQGAHRGEARPQSITADLSPTQACPRCWCCPRVLANPCVTSSLHCSTPGEAPVSRWSSLLSCPSWTTRCVDRTLGHGQKAGTGTHGLFIPLHYCFLLKPSPGAASISTVLSPPALPIGPWPGSDPRTAGTGLARSSPKRSHGEGRCPHWASLFPVLLSPGPQAVLDLVLGHGVWVFPQRTWGRNGGSCGG